MLIIDLTTGKRAAVAALDSAPMSLMIEHGLLLAELGYGDKT
jgi:hypothetical protein